MARCHPELTKVCTKTKRISVGDLLRLGLQVDSSKWITRCDCGKDLDSEGYNLMTCKTGGGPVWTWPIIPL